MKYEIKKQVQSAFQFFAIGGLFTPCCTSMYCFHSRTAIDSEIIASPTVLNERGSVFNERGSVFNERGSVFNERGSVFNERG